MSRLVVLACLCLAALEARAQQTLDAPFVTTPPSVVEAMLKLANVAANDYVIDLGSGDGRIVFAAAQRFGARGHGIELDERLVLGANREAKRRGLADRVRFVTENVFDADLTRATVVTMYMGETVNRRMRPHLFKLKPGTRVVTHEFDLGNWTPDARIKVHAPDKPYGAPYSEVMAWVIPADFSGTWTWRTNLNGADEAHEAVLTQRFQKAEGRGRIAGRNAVVGAEIEGGTVRIIMGGEEGGKATWREFRGRIEGDTVTGTAVTITDRDSTARHGESVPWRATRTVRGRMDIELNTSPFN